MRPVIRGITIRIGAAGRFRHRANASFEVRLDEKPLGRRMHSTQQRSILFNGDLDLSRLTQFVSSVEDVLAERAVLAPDAGFIVETTPGSLSTRRVPDTVRERVSCLLACALERAPAA